MSQNLNHFLTEYILPFCVEDRKTFLPPESLQTLGVSGTVSRSSGKAQTTRLSGPRGKPRKAHHSHRERELDAELTSIGSEGSAVPSAERLIPVRQPKAMLTN